VSRDLHLLPRVADSLTFLYVERSRVEVRDGAVVLVRDEGEVSVPAAALSVLLLGPGTCITAAAAAALADVGSSIVWCGDGAVRCYASGLGETRSSANLEAQARHWADPELRLRVAKAMYAMRFGEALSDALTLQQVRGLEGARVRDAYTALAREWGVRWDGRNYELGNWNSASPVNRALSTANTCLYGCVHAAIVATGFSPGLGFVHAGKSLSFVYDIADLYKMETTAPLAFRIAASSSLKTLEADVRRGCRDLFFDKKLLQRIVPDVQGLFGLRPNVVRVATANDVWAADGGHPTLWDDVDGEVAGGTNYEQAVRA
jgi:CRISP-associated protein Cas1